MDTPYINISIVTYSVIFVCIVQCISGRQLCLECSLGGKTLTKSIVSSLSARWQYDSRITKAGFKCKTLERNKERDEEDAKQDRREKTPSCYTGL